MDDLISRSDAIRIASGYCHWSNIPDELAKLPSVSTEKTGRWIPVSERLPSDCECDWVLAQIQEDNGYLWIPRVMEYRKNIDDWCDECLGWLKDHNGAFSVVAWMPLPQPYTAESEEA